MLRTPKTMIILGGALALLLTFTRCDNRKLPPQSGTWIQSGDPAPGAVGGAISLEQGWTDDTQQRFWFETQGSEIVPYNYFLHLEQAASEDLFRSNENIESYRYLPQDPTDLNPDGLPVGFAKVTDPQSGVDWMGFTCAACHTAQLSYNGRNIRIDGGPAISFYQKFQEDLVSALEATLQNNDKFGRFANGVLGEDHTEQQANTLRNELDEHTTDLARRKLINTSDMRDGYGRVDALGRIFNAASAYNLHLDGNAAMPNAPVSYPFLWSTHQSRLVQWNGSVDNKGVGPVIRNVGEVIGVFANVDIDPERGLRGYQSSVQEKNLGKLEIWIAELQSPQWPDNILPPRDPEKEARGEEVYNQYCVSCHQLVPPPTAVYRPCMVEVDEVQTDPKVLDNFNARNEPTAVGTGRLQGHRVNIIARGPIFKDSSAVISILQNTIAGTLLAHPLQTIDIAAEDADLAFKDSVATSNTSYKARPLNGIWATAPYLHNGSVPTLHDLLLPVAQRPATFHVGNREFDPVKVGYVTTAGPNTFLYDTALPGNRNTGHTYGTDLSEDDRMALIEYLKSLKPQNAQPSSDDWQNNLRNELCLHYE